jgi:hypothetical protein
LTSYGAIIGESVTILVSTVSIILWRMSWSQEIGVSILLAGIFRGTVFQKLWDIENRMFQELLDNRSRMSHELFRH